MATGAVAATVARAQRGIREHFDNAGRGRYWIDREAERLEEQRRHSAPMLMLKVVLIVVALAIAAAAIPGAI